MYLIKEHFLNFGSSFVVFSLSVWAKVSQPKVLEMISLHFYMSMPPMECHHPKCLKSLCLLSKHQYLQHLRKTIRATPHAISYSLQAPCFFVHPFWHTIFLGCYWNCLLSTNPMVWKVILKLSVEVLTSIIWSETLQPFSCLILNQIFPFLKSIKNVIFLSNAINPCSPSCIINKSNIIVRATKRI